MVEPASRSPVRPPTAGSITADPFGTGYAFTDEDTRDPSRYFIAYETGDNTTTAAESQISSIGG